MKRELAEPKAAQAEGGAGMPQSLTDIQDDACACFRRLWHLMRRPVRFCSQRNCHREERPGLIGGQQITGAEICGLYGGRPSSGGNACGHF